MVEDYHTTLLVSHLYRAIGLSVIELAFKLAKKRKTKIKIQLHCVEKPEFQMIKIVVEFYTSSRTDYRLATGTALV